MAIAKKGSRKINVNQTEYTWLIRKKPTYTQSVYGTGKLSLAIEITKDPGTTLHIYTDRNHPKDISSKTIIPITPSDINLWINKALILGWKPSQKGSSFQVELINEEFKKRIKL